ESHIANSPLKPDGKTKDEYTSQYFRTLAIGKAADAVRKTFISNYKRIMAGTYDKELLYDSDAEGLYTVLKQEIGFKHVYNAKETLRLELLGRNVIQSLMDLFWEAEKSHKTKTFPQKIYNLLSQNYRTVFEQPTDDEKQLSEDYRKA